MNCGLKYILSFDSRLGNSYLIRIFVQDYEGEPERRRLGRNPVARMEDGEVIRGTSLELLIEAEYDGDLQEFYTVDNKKFRVEVYCNNDLFWIGYTLPELYSEPYVAAPYDVSITASDGLGILKRLGFNLTGNHSLFEIINYCCEQTGLSLNYVFASTLYANGMDKSKNMHMQAILNCDMFEGNSCYEVIEIIMTTIGSYIKQKNGKWYILRYTDQNSTFSEYDYKGIFIHDFEPVTSTLGSVEDQFFPIGQLESEIIPAKKDFVLEQPYLMYPSLLKNYNFSDKEGWNITSGVRFVSLNEDTYCELKPAKKGEETNNQISQQIDIEATEQPMKIEFQYSICFYNSLDVGSVVMEFDRFFHLIITLQTEHTKYYLTRKGWTTEENIIEIKGTVQNGDLYKTDRTHYNFVPVSYETFKINLSQLPYTGKLSVCIRNPYTYYPNNDITGGVLTGDWKNMNLIGIKDVIINNVLEDRPDLNVLLNSTASTSLGSMKLGFLDTPFSENARNVFKNIIMLSNGFTEVWNCAGSADDSFVNIILQDISSRLDVPLLALRGVIQGGDFDLLFDKYSKKKLYVTEYSYDLLEEEIDCTLHEFIAFNAYVEGDIIQSPRSSNKFNTETRSSGEKEYRSYGGTDSSPKMIRDLDLIQENYLENSCCIEIDDNRSVKSKKVTVERLGALFAGIFWTKEELEYVEGYLTVLKKKIKAGDSDLWNQKAFCDYVNQPVRTIDDVRFKSVSSPAFAPGLSGTGYRIDEKGYAELTGLTLREFLEAPEYRFNRVDVVSGEQWNAPGFGLIESVDAEGCIATLKLEDKELAGIQVGDLCRGLFHNLAGNADGAVTDSCGFLTVAGFSTSYFTPVELLEDGKSFRYELKPGTAVHPSPAMKFAVYGNFTDKSRQSSAYSTRTYKRYLKEVNTWEIDPQRNVAMQFGDLSGLYINGVDMSGYSAWLNNIYFSGHVEWTPGQLEEIRGKDGYSVNLTSYDAVVAVDSQGRIDNSLYDIINIVNGEELVQSAGMQVVATRYKIQTEIQACRGQVRLEHSDSPGEGMYTAAFTAKGCEYSFAAGVLTITKITEDKAGVEIEVNCEGAATFTMKFVLTRVYGGEAGPEGMISRVSEWAEGFYYRNDTETETGTLRYLDLVVVTDVGTGTFACYQAKAAHNGVASSELNRPGNEVFWTRMSQLPPIYTPLILAENGVIRFAQSNQLLIQKADGKITAGASGKGDGSEGIRFWAGADDPSLAPWRVDETGKMIAEHADITGKITATSGEIGSFEISNNTDGKQPGRWLTSGTSMFMSSKQLHYEYDGHNVFIGSHPSQSVGGGELLSTFLLADGNLNGLNLTSKVALIAVAPKGLDSEFARKYAIWSRGAVKMDGRISYGLSIIDATPLSPVLSNNEHIVIVKMDTPITLILPGNAEVGQELRIRKCGSGNITLNGPIMRKWNTVTQEESVTNNRLAILIYTGDYWTLNLIE